MKFVYCPICGHKLLEGSDPSDVKVKCSKCKTIVRVKIANNSVGVAPVSDKTT